MKKLAFIILNLILSLLLIASSINNDLKLNPLYDYNDKLIITKDNKIEKYNKKRLLSDNDNNDGFTQIRIFIDKTYIQNQNSQLLDSYNKVILAIDKCVRTIQKLIKVKRIGKIKFSDNDLAVLDLDSNKIDPKLLPSGEGIETDLVIIPKFLENNSIICLGKPLIFDSSSKRPIGGILSINKYLPEKENIENYLESIILHQFTHILGFKYELFNNFPGGISKVINIGYENRTNTEKKFVITPKVISFAKKYFNCDSITGVELEEEGGYDDYENSHWEARILLGEYMNSETHTPEQAISGFTLALLEDSGWYKANNYTGGLMRFGKNQGCDFLYKDCEVSEKSKNNFKNEFFTFTDFFRSTCTSGRQSRSYSAGESFPNRNIQLGGKLIADLCFVSDLDESEENIMFYVGSCSKGGGEYGSRIFYNNNQKSKNGNIPEIFGEKISSNSFCILSSAIPTVLKLEDTTKYNYYHNIIHPMCYPMFCSEKSLTIQIYNQYIVCPRGGGIVELKGDFEGHIYCPDYNLICTGTVMCNDMFECVEKESLEKLNTFDYDYEINTSQEIISENQLTENDISVGYELSENNDSKCPQHCNQCKENKKCFICENGYKLIGIRENDENPIICIQDIDLSFYYHNVNDNTYYLCLDNCQRCTSGNQCDICDPKYKLNDEHTNCEERIPNCKIYDENYENCEECKEDYYLLNDDRLHCYNDIIDEEKFFTEDEGKTFISCEEVIDNCLKCNRRDYCNQCSDGYRFEPENIICTLKIPHCLRFDSDYELCEECEEGYYLINEDKSQCHNEPIDDEIYFTENEGKTYSKCENAISNCLKCENRNNCNLCKDGYFLENNECSIKIPHCKFLDNNYEFCKECDEGYYLLNEDKSQCHNEPIDDEKYFTENDGKVYIKCEEVIENCIKCQGRNSCTECINSHKVAQNGKICESKIPNCKIYDSNYEKCEECDENYYFLNNDFTKCYNNPINNSYFTEDNGKTYLSCENEIQNCIKCNKRDYCIDCKDGYIIDEGNSLCILFNVPNIECNIQINNINDKDLNFIKEESNIFKLIQEYDINNKNKLGQVEHYINNIYNYSITIFKYSECTENLFFEQGYYLNTSDITLLYDNGFFINCFITYNSTNIINFYKNSNGEKIDMEENCPQCLDLKYTIKNNFTDEFLNYYSPLLLEKIKKEKIDLFSDNEILNDKCNSFEYGGLNIPIKIRNTLFYNDSIEGLLCTDQYCSIISQNLEEFTADCECKIHYDLNYLFKEKDKVNNNSIQNISSSSINSLNIFSCLFNNKNPNYFLKTFAFYFSLSSGLIEIISFIFYVVYKQKINLDKFSIKNSNDDKLKGKTNEVETENKENNIIPTEENIRQSASSIEKLKSNPPPRNSILYKYKWFKNKPKILSLENSHDEDLEIQSRDEGDPENEIMRKIKNISFFDKNTSNISSFLEDDTLSDRDKMTETSKNKITLIAEDKSKKLVEKKEEKRENNEKQMTDIKNKKDLEIHGFSPKKEETLKISPLPQVLTREENARKKKKTHSIKNIQQTKELTYSNKVIEEKKIKSLLQIYLDIICIKQHIINFFSFFFNSLDAESFIPLQMKIIRFIFLLILNIFFNTLFIGENYFIEKYNFFNHKYDLEKKAKANFIISKNEKINYAFKHCFKNSFISFLICFIIEIIIGLIFFGTKRKIDNIIEIKEKISQKKEYDGVMSKIRINFIIFFVVNIILIAILSCYIIEFNMIYDKSVVDFLIPSLITFIILQIIPFIISIIIAIIMYNGLKKENKKIINIAKYLLF